MKRVLRWTALGGLAVSYSYCLWHTITSHVITAVVCWGESMQPTINKNSPYKDIVLVEYLSKWRNRLKKGDVVVALNPWRPDELICKRITAVEGEKIPAGCRDLHKTSVIPRGHVWLEGDNRLSSYDSRDHGAIPLPLVQGRVWYKVYPFSAKGPIK